MLVNIKISMYDIHTYIHACIHTYIYLYTYVYANKHRIYIYIYAHFQNMICFCKYIYI